MFFKISAIKTLFNRQKKCYEVIWVIASGMFQKNKTMYDPKKKKKKAKEVLGQM